MLGRVRIRFALSFARLCKHDSSQNTVTAVRRQGDTQISAYLGRGHNSQQCRLSHDVTLERCTRERESDCRCPFRHCTQLSHRYLRATLSPRTRDDWRAQSVASINDGYIARRIHCARPARGTPRADPARRSEAGIVPMGTIAPPRPHKPNTLPGVRIPMLRLVRQILVSSRNGGLVRRWTQREGCANCELRFVGCGQEGRGR